MTAIDRRRHKRFGIVSILQCRSGERQHCTRASPSGSGYDVFFDDLDPGRTLTMSVACR
jgi:hypothetical protein